MKPLKLLKGGIRQNEENYVCVKFYEDENILIEALLEIDNNFDEVYKLLNSLNLENINNSNQDFYDSYNYFYERKYDKRIEEDEIYNLTQKKYFTQK